MVNGKSKGNAFERSICKQLSLWWSGGESDDIFWKSQNSGGRATSRGKKGKTTSNQSGDVCVSNADGVGKDLLRFMTLELKRGYTEQSIMDLLDSPNPKNTMFGTWVQQAEAASRNEGSKSYAIIVQRNRRKAMIFMPITAWVDLGKDAMFRACPKIIAKFRGVAIPNTKGISMKTLVGVLLEDFLKYVDAEDVRKANKKSRRG